MMDMQVEAAEGAAATDQAMRLAASEVYDDMVWAL
jgi:hypothetical protein